MKVVYASTPTQEEKINELIQLFYSTIFPYYFSDDDIRRFSRLGVLSPTDEQMEQIRTLKSSYQVIASLQTILSILENKENMDEYKQIFEKNVDILNDLQLFFPFSFENFKDRKETEMHGTAFSMYTEATNSYLV
ncbi:DUF5365 family protein [Niallia nealsonii]|uniref:Uncharacterized protein n=1 Tax=Niallia nealsonii TaxID=115979 RepID=A0A2N0Z7D1_9BACI|nr:DUF5365 family protein [Niallia nealsonii]PKG25393.1 hypothetical protein CWS01_00700 [Niallia nealsonii]